MLDEQARGALHLTLGRGSTHDDVAALLAVVGDVVARTRAAALR